MTSPADILRAAKAKIEDRFMSHVSPEPNSGCWLWDGCIFQGGYGQIRIRGKNKKAHRVAYELFRGPIPKGLHLDHLCRVRSCVNPDHLEPVTNRENILRGETVTAANAAKTHCKNGHALAGENLYRTPDGRRVCRQCRRDAGRRYRERRAIELAEQESGQ